MTYETDRRLFHATRLAGWTHDEASGGFRKGDLWVSWGQAEMILDAADAREQASITPQSETLAKIIVGAANDGHIEALRGDDPGDETHGR